MLPSQPLKKASPGEEPGREEGDIREPCSSIINRVHKLAEKEKI